MAQTPSANSLVSRLYQQHRPSLIFIAQMSGDEFERLDNTLLHYTVREELGRTEIVDYLSNSNLGVDTSQAAGLIDALLAAMLVARLNRIPLDQLARDLWQTVFEGSEHSSTNKGVSLSKEFGRRLAQLSSTPAIANLIKAHDVFSQHDQTFVDGRVFTDVRAVYGDDPDEPPSGAIVVHNLRLQYLREGEQRSITVALRRQDLEELAQQIERARRKAISLNRLITANKLATIDPTLLDQ